MTQDRKPDWDFWSYVPDVTILQAVALSRDIDPNLINYRTHRLAYGEEVTKRDESPEFEKRLAICVRNLNTLSARGREDVDELEDCSVKLVKFTAVALSWNWTLSAEMAALAEPDKRDAEILNLKQQVEVFTEERDTWKRTAEDSSANTTNAARGELTKAQHAKTRERTLAAVLATIATADRKDYTNKSDQKIVVTKLAGLVEDNRTKYEKPRKILSVEEIKNLVGKVLNGDYFS